MVLLGIISLLLKYYRKPGRHKPERELAAYLLGIPRTLSFSLREHAP